MKSLLHISLLLITTLASTGQTVNPNLDTALVKSLGADDYGMKMYVFVILKTGSNTIENKATRDSLFAGHMANITRLADLKKLVVAGPFGKNDDSLRGLFILDVRTFEDANKLLEADPAIKEKLLEPELYNWYGSAALPEYLKAHDKVWKHKP